MKDDEREHEIARLGLLDALVAAQERRDEVMAALADSEDRPDAQRRLTTLLNLSAEWHVMAVLDMQMEQWTRQAQLRIRRERDELRDRRNALYVAFATTGRCRCR